MDSCTLWTRGPVDPWTRVPVVPLTRGLEEPLVSWAHASNFDGYSLLRAFRLADSKDKGSDGQGTEEKRREKI